MERLTNVYRELTPYTRSDIIKQLQELLSPSRYQHVLRVEQTAIQLAKQYDVNVGKVSLAALLHDYAKELPVQKMRDYVMSDHLDLDMIPFGVAICHGPVGAVLAQKRFDVEDLEVLEAIRYHTYGHPRMSDVAKVIYVADYIEPNRAMPPVDKARQLAGESLDQAIAYITCESIRYLTDCKQLIYPATIDTYNAYAVSK